MVIIGTRHAIAVETNSVVLDIAHKCGEGLWRDGIMNREDSVFRQRMRQTVSIQRQKVIREHEAPQP